MKLGSNMGNDGRRTGGMLLWTQLLCGVVFMGAMPATAGEVKEVSTRLETVATPYLGNEHRDTVNGAVQLAGKGEAGSAQEALEPVLAFCDALQSDGDTRVVSVSGPSEEAAFVASSGPDTPVTFVDMACPMAYKMAGFIAVSARDATAAFAYLDQAQQIAPYWAEPLAEKAYLMGQLGDRVGSLETYHAALELAEKYPGSAYVKPMILRGIGYALIELGDLDAAQLAYEASLQLDPSSEVARNELLYIEQARERRATQD